MQSVLPLFINFLLWAYPVHRGILCQVPFKFQCGAWVRHSKAESNIGQMKNRRSLLSMRGLTEEGLSIYWLHGHGSEPHGLKLEEVVPLTWSQNVDPELLLRMWHWLEFSRWNILPKFLNKSFTLIFMCCTATLEKCIFLLRLMYNDIYPKNA